jgi:hypothetical protein
MPTYRGCSYYCIIIFDSKILYPLALVLRTFSSMLGHSLIRSCCKHGQHPTSLSLDLIRLLLDGRTSLLPPSLPPVTNTPPRLYLFKFGQCHVTSRAAPHPVSPSVQHLLSYTAWFCDTLSDGWRIPTVQPTSFGLNVSGDGGVKRWFRFAPAYALLCGMPYPSMA